MTTHEKRRQSAWRHSLAGMLLMLSSTAIALPAAAETPKDVLVEVAEYGPNALDVMAPGANDGSQLVTWQIFDRLVTYGVKTSSDGRKVYDKDKIEPSLAESWEVKDDGKTMIFHLRKDATFHDGSPVTANDVKWSFERAIATGAFPAVQFAAGGYTDPSVFSVVDEHTFKISLPKANKLALPDLTMIVASVVNSKLALSHATPDDPWALNWTRNNDAGGGPYKVSKWTAGNQVVFDRFDDWKSGKLPALKKVVYRIVASAGTRRALLEKGDADIAVGLPPKENAELAAAGNVNVVGDLIQNEMYWLSMQVDMKPFNDVRVRKAIAYALPYDAIMKQAFYDRAVPMYGAKDATSYPPKWPAVSPYYTDLDKAKALLAEAGYADGFSTELFIDLTSATVQEPMALLIQEQLKKIGIEVTINKVPASERFAKMASKTMPMDINSFYGWLDYPEYFFFWNYHGKNNSVFNTSNYKNAELDKLVDSAQSNDLDNGQYNKAISDMIGIVMNDVPRVPVAQVFSDVAMRKNVVGYTYWYHTHVDYRDISKQ